MPNLLLMKNTTITHSRSPFFFWMAGLCAFYIFTGFIWSYLGPLATGSLSDFSVVVHIHGILFFAWTIFLVLQSGLVLRKRVGLHRNLGLAGISLATAMVIFGFMVSLLANAERMEAGNVARAYSLGFSNTFVLIAFAVMVAIAISKRNHPASHKRLMLLATCMLLNAPVGRLYRPLFSPAFPPPWLVFVTVDIILIALLIYDWKTLRRIHSATATAGLILLASQIIRFPLAKMTWWHETYDMMLRLVDWWYIFHFYKALSEQNLKIILENYRHGRPIGVCFIIWYLKELFPNMKWAFTWMSSFNQYWD